MSPLLRYFLLREIYDNQDQRHSKSLLDLDYAHSALAQMSPDKIGDLLAGGKDPDTFQVELGRELEALIGKWGGSSLVAEIVGG